MDHHVLEQSLGVVVDEFDDLLGRVLHAIHLNSVWNSAAEFGSEQAKIYVRQLSDMGAERETKYSPRLCTFKWGRDVDAVNG